jgi:predicted metal-binding membrane protein
VESILRRERIVLGGCLVAMTVLAWLYLFHLGSSMSKMDMGGMDMPGMNMPGMDMRGMDMAGMDMTGIQPWTFATVFLLFVMWSVMMVAMMLPSASPMIFAFLKVNRGRQAANRPFVPVTIFLLGYLAVWTGFSAVATAAQWGLHRAALLSPAMAATSPLLNGGLLIAAGIFQWTSLKLACLRGCRSPLSFLMGEWRDGRWGAFMMGLRHGTFCVGCCWFLMALLFVAGVMNLLWVAVIALFVMAEKILPKGELLARASGAVLILAGVAMAARFW